MSFPEGNAIVYCEGAFASTNGKTAHGLVRRTVRYKVLSVVDSKRAGEDSGIVLDGRPNRIPIHNNIQTAFELARSEGNTATHLVIGLAPDGGRLAGRVKQDILRAIDLGLNVDAGLHDFLNDDPQISAAAKKARVTLRDVRRPPPREKLHAFTGVIEKVKSYRIALLGTDSAVGKRTTAWVLVDALRAAGRKAELVGTGQTAWMQGAKYGILLDSLINDFVAGEIEHAIHEAWTHEKPDFIVIEGQGSLMNPAYPSGLEILAAGRPDAVVLQHAPARKEYDGFPGYAMHPLSRQIEAIHVLSDCPVVAITINDENIPTKDLPAVCAQIEQETGLPTLNVLKEGGMKLVKAVLDRHKPTA